MRNSTISIILICILVPAVNYADWNDITIAQDNEITDGDKYIQVSVRSINNTTTVNVTGGQIGTLFAHDNSIINMSGGTFRPEYYNYHPENNDGDNLFLAPYTHSVYLEDSSMLNYYGADLHSILCDHQSTLNYFDGMASLSLSGNSNIYITGGNIAGISYNDDFPFPRCSSHLSISGGTFSGMVSLIDESVADIFGYGFVYDPDGWVNDDPRFRGKEGGELRGYWANGDPFTIKFVDTFGNHSYSHITLYEIPEPTTLSLLALGAIFMKRRNYR